MSSPSPSALPQTWQVVARNEDYLLASWREIFAVVWLRETSIEGVLKLHAASAEYALSSPGGIGLLAIVSRHAWTPSSAQRKQLAYFLTNARYIRCSAVVMEGSGFRAATVRSVVTALDMLARYPFPQRVCDLEDAIAMFMRELPPATRRPLSEAALTLALRALRELAGLT
jgi:hypothetical protein